MPENRDVAPWVWILASLGSLAAIAGALLAAGRSTTSPLVIVVAGAAFSVSAFVAVPTRQGSTRTMAHGVGTAIPLMTVSGTVLFDLSGALAAGLGGLGVTWLVTAVKGWDQRRMAPHILVGMVTFLAYLVTMSTLGTTALFDQVGGWERTGLFLVSALAAFACETILNALLAVGRLAGSLRYRVARSAGDLDSFLAVAGAGALFGLSYDLIGWWALVVCALPYSFAHTSLSRLQGTRKTYEQTLRALAQIPEVAGHARAGHALTAHDLARLVALDMGLTPRQVERTRHAALMHQVGLVALNEPGVLLVGYTDLDVARWGAEVLGEATHLDPVAAIVRRQFDPYRLPAGPFDPTLDLPTRIVRVVGAYCTLTEEGDTPAEALDVLQRGSADSFDPEVVSKLRAVLERTVGLFHPVARAQ